MFCKNLCILVLWTKVTSAMEGLKDSSGHTLIHYSVINLENLHSKACWEISHSSRTHHGPDQPDSEVGVAQDVWQLTLGWGRDQWHTLEKNGNAYKTKLISIQY